MNADSSSPADKKAGAGALVGALFDFEAMPGRYSLTLREPRVLFDHPYIVLQLACGRKVEALSLADDVLARAHRAARYFVRTAMLRHGTDYYTLMGVQPGFEEAALRDNYRLLIRLSHPDFATQGQTWPADAAMRINLANDILSSPVKRHEYDMTLKNSRAQVAAAFGAPRQRTAPLRPVAPPRERGPGVVAASGALLLGLLKGAGPVRLGSARVLVASSLVAAMGASALTAWLMLDSRRGSASADLVARGEQAAVPTGVPAWRPGARSNADTSPYERPSSASAAAAQSRPPGTDGPPLRLTLSGDLGGALAMPGSTALSRPAPEVAARPAGMVPGAGVAASAVAAREASRRAAPTQPLQSTPYQAQLATRAALASPAPTAFAYSSLAVPAVEQVPAPMPVQQAPQMPQAVVATNATPPNSMLSNTSAAGGNATAGTNTPRVKLTDVQPTLAYVVSAVQSGRVENVLALLEPSSRRSDTSNQFAQAYGRALAGARTVYLGQVRFSSAPSPDDQLVVDGVIQLYVQDQNSVTTPRDFPVRAFFVSRGGSPVLTRLSTTERP
ncbi:MAG: hypothetical protein EOO28_27435 [Comamonadaceae bacterium]|nr:MAG: hypothetical protein EOO28_27435 [Comamonadaceae bacterium]